MSWTWPGITAAVIGGVGLLVLVILAVKGFLFTSVLIGLLVLLIIGIMMVIRPTEDNDCRNSPSQDTSSM